MAFKLLRNVHWAAPALMCSCFGAAILFAIAHHLYYFSLGGGPVMNESEQPWVSRPGNGVAFIIKTLLTTSTSVAFVQWFWFRLRKTSTTLRKTDVLFGLIYDPANFLQIKYWVDSLPLGFLAIVTWSIPLSAIFAPGAIVAQLQTYTTTQSMPLSEANFDTSVYFASYSSNSSPMVDVSIYHSVIQWAMLERGNIAPVIHSNKDCNVSYHSEFVGPSVTCRLADQKTTGHVNRVARASALQNGIRLKILVDFVGFQNSSERRDYMPFPTPASGNASRMHILFPHLDDDNATLYTCDFVNATYQVDFDLYSDSSQRIRAVTTDLKPLRFKDYLYTLDIQETPIAPSDAQKRNYLGMASNFVRIARGKAFSRMLSNASADGASNPTYSNSTRDNFGLNLSPRFGDQTGNRRRTWPRPSQYHSIVKVWEDTFKNTTVSARYGLNSMNFPAASKGLYRFLSNTTINATVTMNRMQYKYTPLDLLLPYGLSILLALVCNIMGGYAMIKGHASYSHDFSTVLRFVSDVEQFGLEDDRQAADPLPRHLKKAVLEHKGAAMGDDGDRGSEQGVRQEVRQETQQEVVEETSEQEEKGIFNAMKTRFGLEG